MKVVMLLAALTALLLGVGYVAGGANGALIALVISVVLNMGSYWFSDKLALARFGAKEVTDSSSKVVQAATTVARNAGIPVPKTYIIPTKAPNAFATGRNPEHAAVAVSEGLLELLNRDELEGVIGHEIAHIANRDTLISAMAATIGGAIGFLASMARWGAIFGGVGGNDRNRGGGNPLFLIVAAIVAPIAAAMIQMAISRSREFKADATGAGYTNRYLALANALRKIDKAPVRIDMDRHPSSAHMFIYSSFNSKAFTNLFSTHPPVEERVARLEKLASTGGLSALA